MMVIEGFPKPKVIKELHQVLGLCKLYPEYVPKCAQLAPPLMESLQTKHPKTAP